MSELTIKGEIRQILYQDLKSGFMIIKIYSYEEKEDFVASGVVGDVKVGEFFLFTGSWESSKYGEKLVLSNVSPLSDYSFEEIKRYLSSGIIAGLGEGLSDKIVEKFKDKTFEIFDKYPLELKKITGIGEVNYELIVNSWKEHSEKRETYFFLNKHHIPLSLASKIYKKYQKRTQEIITANPYKLIDDIHGVGFKIADSIALKLKVTKDSPMRLKAATVYILKEAEKKGHCYLSHMQLMKELCFFLQLSVSTINKEIENVLNQLESEEEVFSEEISPPLSDGSNYFHALFSLFESEIYIAEKIKELVTIKTDISEEKIDAALKQFSPDINYSGEQLEAIKMAVSHQVFILTGGPGVGKTTTSNAIISLLSQLGKTIEVVAPTGRAAQRISEVSGRPASTIHRLLEFNPEGGFKRNESDPIMADVVVVDEASMLDVRLAKSLLRAIKKGGQIIFIGDVDQLPSVGAGNVLKDLIESGHIPQKKLTKIFRQGEDSDIIKSSYQINQGEVPKLENKAGSNCRYLLLDEVEKIVNLLKYYIKNEVKEKYQLDPIKEVQILTPMNKGDLGTKVLNHELQKILNPKKDGLDDLHYGDVTFRTKDKVIQTYNNYNLNIFNGDIGYIEKIYEDAKMLINFNGKAVMLSKEDLDDLKLAYAITVHKSQGSEFPLVIIPLHSSQTIMLQRNLLYTAITRAKKQAVIIGEKKAIEKAIFNNKNVFRQTLLKFRLKEMFLEEDDSQKK